MKIKQKKDLIAGQRIKSSLIKLTAKLYHNHVILSNRGGFSG